MKIWTWITLLVIVLSCSGLVDRSRVSQAALETSVSNVAYRKGNFELSNTTETVEMITNGAQESTIGTEYNFTLKMNASSTSGINLTLTKLHSWRGSPFVFQMVPNETRTVNYVQHSTSDELGILSFQYHLLNTSGIAKGTYEIIRVFVGYDAHYDPLTGSLYVDNITAWLIAKSQASSNTTNFTFSIPLILLTMAITISYRKSSIKNSRN